MGKLADKHKKLLEKKDNVFLTFENSNLELKNDFEISFDYGFSTLRHFEYLEFMKSVSTEKPIKMVGLMKKKSENGLGVFISNTNKITITPSGSYFCNSFTPSLNRYQTDPLSVSPSSRLTKLEEFDSILNNDIYKIRTIQSRVVKNIHEKINEDIERQKAEIAHLSLRKQHKYWKEKVKEDREKRIILAEAEKLKTNPTKLFVKPQITDMTYYNVKIIKKGLKMEIYITHESGYIETVTIDFKYSNRNKIYFGLSNSSPSQGMGYAQKDEFFTIRNFILKQ